MESWSEGQSHAPALGADPHELFAFSPIKDAAGPLVLARDPVILDPLVDAGADAPMLIDAFFRERRRVFVDLAKLPAVFERMRVGREVSVVVPGREPIVELLHKA